LNRFIPELKPLDSNPAFLAWYTHKFMDMSGIVEMSVIINHTIVMGQVECLAMNNVAYKIIDHTADMGLIIYGSDMEKLFSNAAFSVFSLIVEPESIIPKLQRYVRVSAENYESLLIEWLNELIYLFDAEHILFNSFQIRNLSNNQLIAICYGELVDRLRHNIKREVKAATYHMLKIDRQKSGYKAEVIFDL
jgi:SHS2 domain-containing protein